MLYIQLSKIWLQSLAAQGYVVMLISMVCSGWSTGSRRQRYCRGSSDSTAGTFEIELGDGCSVSTAWYPLPQMQTLDRLSGEPPAWHQLVWSIDAFEDYNCDIFGSGLLIDGRSPFGSFCSLRCQNHVLLLSFSEACHFSCLYLALIYGATMYFVL
jgi:hypothetical protein